MDDQLIRGHLPVLILGLIADRPMHGYELAKEIKLRGADQLRLGEGTLYPLLHRLEAQGRLESDWAPSTRGKQRKVYRITPKGRRKLRDALADWRELKDIFKKIMGETWEQA